MRKLRTTKHNTIHRQCVHYTHVYSPGGRQFIDRGLNELVGEAEGSVLRVQALDEALLHQLVQTRRESVLELGRHDGVQHLLVELHAWDGVEVFLKVRNGLHGLN